MQRWIKICSVVLGLIVALALSPTVASSASLSKSKHDFTTTDGTAPFNQASDICATCHTPHHAIQTQLIWNQKLAASLTFGASQTTTSGTSLPTNIGSAPGTSKFCLSCHDGSVAVGDLNHDPWADLSKTKITGDKRVTDGAGNLAGNHPVEIPYPNPSGKKYNGIDSKAATASYVDATTVAATLKLFSDPTVSGSNGLACASCHNPHGTSNAPFLRVARSSLCTTCHNL